MQDLGRFPGAIATGPPYCHTINNSGVIVGLSIDASFNERAIVWQNNVPVDLNTLIPANSGWYLECAQGINDAGEIVGFGTLNGGTHAFPRETQALESRGNRIGQPKHKAPTGGGECDASMLLRDRWFAMFHGVAGDQAPPLRPCERARNQTGDVPHGLRTQRSGLLGFAMMPAGFQQSGPFAAEMQRSNFTQRHREQLSGAR